MATKKKAAKDVPYVDPYPTPEYPPEEVLSEEGPTDPDGEEQILNVTLSIKDAILFYLFTYSGKAKDPAMKAGILDSYQVLKKGLVSLKGSNIDRAKGSLSLSLSIRKDYSRELIDQHLSQVWTRLALAEVYGYKEQFLKDNKEKNREQDKPQHIKTGKHLVSQFLGPVSPQTKLNFAETLERYTQETGLTMGNRPLGWGLDLNVAQQRVTSAILEAFSRDEYQGQITLPKEEVLTDPERGPSYAPAKVRSGGPSTLYRKADRNIPQLPTILLTLAEIVKLAGYDHGRQGDKEKVKEAVAQLGADRYLFYWKRKAFTIRNRTAVPERDAQGEHKWEEIVEDGSLFRVKHVLDEQTKELKYFEISPSAVVLDQVSPLYGGNYFLMVPRDLHVEIQKAVGKGKKSSSYTFAFLMYLLSEYERHRSHAKKGTAPEVRISKPWEEIAQRIKMPETVWKRNRKTAIANLERVYLVAKELGYLKAYRRGADGVDTLELEPSKYFRPEKELQEGAEEAP